MPKTATVSRRAAFLPAISRSDHPTKLGNDAWRASTVRPRRRHAKTHDGQICRLKRVELETLAHHWSLSTAGLTVSQIRDMLYQADSALQALGWIPAQPLPPQKQWHPAVPGHDVPESPESTEFESPDFLGATAPLPRPQAQAKEHPVARGSTAPQPLPKGCARPARGSPVPEPRPPRPPPPPQSEQEDCGAAAASAGRALQEKPAVPKPAPRPPAPGGRAQQRQAEQEAREGSQAERGPAGLSLAQLFQQAEQDARQALPRTASEAEVAARAARILPYLVPTHPDQPAARSTGWDLCG